MSVMFWFISWAKRKPGNGDGNPLGWSECFFDCLCALVLLAVLLPAGKNPRSGESVRGKRYWHHPVKLAWI